MTDICKKLENYFNDLKLVGDVVSLPNTSHNDYGCFRFMHEELEYVYLHNKKSVNLSLVGINEKNSEIVINTKSSVVFPSLKDLTCTRKDIYLDSENNFNIKSTPVNLVINSHFINLNKDYLNTNTKYPNHFYAIKVSADLLKFFNISTVSGRLYVSSKDTTLFAKPQICLFNSVYDEETNSIYTNTLNFTLTQLRHYHLALVQSVESKLSQHTVYQKSLVEDSQKKAYNSHLSALKNLVSKLSSISI